MLFNNIAPKLDANDAREKGVLIVEIENEIITAPPNNDWQENLYVKA